MELPAFHVQGRALQHGGVKQHCAFGFWKGSLVLDGAMNADAMGQSDASSNI